MRLLLIAGAAALLASCTATQDLANACQGAAGSLATAADLRKAGKLSPASISKIDVAAQLINPICTSPTPPVSLSTGVSVVTEEVGVVVGIIKGGN